MGSLRVAEAIVEDHLGALQQVFPDYAGWARTLLDQMNGVSSAGVLGQGGRGYLLCITPRSGSTYLSDVLAKTGSLGVAKEHFPNEIGTPLPAWLAACGNLNDAFDQLAEIAPLGYFGIKGSLSQMFPLITEGVFVEQYYRFKHIYLTREDKLAQAISLARAQATNEWHSPDKPVHDPDLSPADVLQCLRQLRCMEADWETVFTAMRVDPLRVTYEELLADPGGTFERIRCYLDVQWEIDPMKVVSEYRPIRDRHSPEWRRKLLSMFTPTTA